MARTPFHVEVLTPEGEVFNGEVEMLSTRTEVGSIGVLANHTPLLAMLNPAELRLYRTETDIVRFAQGEGYIQIGGNKALVLVEDAIDPAAGKPAASPSPSAAPAPFPTSSRRSAHEAPGRLSPESLLADS